LLPPGVRGNNEIWAQDAQRRIAAPKNFARASKWDNSTSDSENNASAVIAMRD